MLIDEFAPEFDVEETHRLEIAASASAVYAALWTTDLGGSRIVRGLMTLRSLPKMLFGAGAKKENAAPVAFTLETLITAGFGKLAEDEGREVVLGVNGRFWRPVDNLLPFRREDFARPVPVGTARAVWNFHVTGISPHRTLLTTQTRVLCGDATSRLKFRAYWVFVRPFSGWIRMVMLRAIADE
ncbi:MAG: hypothetical protein ABR587_16285, partial [Candidatus Binatia bacterium]